jgi:hypothetical protein
MDAMKVLGGLLSQRAGRPGTGGGLLGQVLNGVAAATATTNNVGQPTSGIESLVRDAIVRHHHAGGQIPPPATAWIQQRPTPMPGGYPYVHAGQSLPAQYPNSYIPSQAPNVRGAPIPNQDVPRDPNYNNLSYDHRGEILIQAMIMAAQADGKIDADEQARILQQLQPLTQNEVDYLNRAFGTRHDIEAFVTSVPRGMEHEVYQATMMAINLDNERELQYLRNLAIALRIPPENCNQLHANYGMRGVF